MLKIALFISQPSINRFRSNLVGRCTSQFPWWTFNKKNRNYANSRWRTDTILKIVFWLYLGAIFADPREVWNRDEGSHADIVHVNKSAIFANSRWRMTAILKTALSPYVSRELTDFDRIWYTDTNFHSEHGNLTKNRNFSNSRWRTDAILKIDFWQYLSAILANLCKFRNGDEESQADIEHLTKVAIFANSKWRRAAILKIALYPYRSRNYPISIKFGMPMQISIPLFDKKIEIFQIQDGEQTPYWKSFSCGPPP